MSWDATVSGILLIPLLYAMAIPECQDQPSLVQLISSCSLTLSLFCRRHLPHEASCWFAFGWRNNNARSGSRHQRAKVCKVKKSETSTLTLTANSIKQCLYNISFFNNSKMLFVRCHFVQHIYIAETRKQTKIQTKTQTNKQKKQTNKKKQKKTSKHVTMRYFQPRHIRCSASSNCKVVVNPQAGNVHLLLLWEMAVHAQWFGGCWRILSSPKRIKIRLVVVNMT